MSLTYQELIDLSIEQALAGQPGSAPADLEMRAEAFAPRALGEIARQVAGDENRRRLLLRTITIALAAGVGTIPDTVLVECLENATLINPDGVTEEYSYVPGWDDYRGTGDRRLGYFTVRSLTLDVTPPGQPYAVGGGKTGDIDLVASTAPVVPTNAIDQITNFPDELKDDTIALLASMLKG